jgi:hypothetical protein
MFRSRTFAVANAYTLLLYAALGGSMFFVPYAMIDAQQYAPVAAGAVMLPFVVVRFVLSPWSGGLVARFGPGPPLVGGALLAGLAFIGFSLPGLGGSYWTTYFPAVLLLGFAGVLFIAPLTQTVFDASADEHSGMASAINNAVARIAGLLAVAVFGLVLATVFERGFTERLAVLPVSAQTRALAAAEPARFVAGSVPAEIPAGDRPAVAAAIASAYIDGFRANMRLTALVAFAAAALALAALRPGPKGILAGSALPP